MTNVQQISLSPELAAAIVAAQAEAESLHRDGSGQHGAYTSSDEIAAVARGLLTRHGLAWVRVGVELLAPTLSSCDLGNQAYVGDLLERWVLVHQSGAALVADGSKMPVVASRGRPHDKAVGASLTYDAGAVLRGLLCLDREDKDAPDRRHDPDDGRRQTAAPPPRPPLPPATAKPNDELERVRQLVADAVDTYAEDAEVSRGQAWVTVQALGGFANLGGGKGPWGCELGVLEPILAAVRQGAK